MIRDVRNLRKQLMDSNDRGARESASSSSGREFHGQLEVEGYAAEGSKCQRTRTCTSR